MTNVNPTVDFNGNAAPAELAVANLLAAMAVEREPSPKAKLRAGMSRHALRTASAWIAIEEAARG